ncbi:type II toxin-antitoxin system RelE/ParE family toxin [Halobacterium noricense]|uniref:type II toxin-antitoxin system RelE/ParE family toxin n=1 Tax=Halobacterium noricense TaxID=223182 RepID=UPI001E446610|nr:type II toxin-antitoxin system RelE/ParE family toxin [Halobacterium noricense]UHH27250.1 type II toxin-antitoxin system RelE/ParE family toxin [Halobacterium noricense]
MPHAPSYLEILPSARDDIAGIQEYNPEHAERILKKIQDWQEKIQWGRVPQEHMTYLTDAGPYNFYRDYVGKSGYRVIYEISSDTMRVVAVLPKGDDTYDVDELTRRMNRHT